MIYVFHIASLYDRRGDGIAGADIIVFTVVINDVTTVRLHCTMLHPELICVVLYIDNVQQYRQRNKYKRKTSDSVSKIGFHCSTGTV